MNYLISPSPASTSNGNNGGGGGIIGNNDSSSSSAAVVLLSNQLSTSCGNILKRESLCNFGGNVAYGDTSVSASSINVAFGGGGGGGGNNGVNHSGGGLVHGLCSPTQTSIRKCFSLIDDFMECHSDYDVSDSASKLMFINRFVKFIKNFTIIISIKF